MAKLDPADFARAMAAVYSKPFKYKDNPIMVKPTARQRLQWLHDDLVAAWDVLRGEARADYGDDY